MIKTIRQLKNIILKNNFTTLVKKYHKSDGDIKLYHFRDNIYTLTYRYIVDDPFKFIKKTVFFEVENNRNILLYCKLANNHTYLDGIRYDFNK